MEESISTNMWRIIPFIQQIPWVNFLFITSMNFIGMATGVVRDGQTEVGHPNATILKKTLAPPNESLNLVIKGINHPIKMIMEKMPVVRIMITASIRSRWLPMHRKLKLAIKTAHASSQSKIAIRVFIIAWII